MSVRSLRRGSIAASRGAAAPSTVTVMRTTGIAWASTPDSAANSVTGDIDLRMKVKMNDWTQTGDALLAEKWGASGNRTFNWYMRSLGDVHWIVSTTGSNSLSGLSSATTGFTDGTIHSLRITRVAATGVRTHYTSDDWDPATDTGTWTQLGTTTNPGTGNLFNSTAPVTVGDINGGGAPLLGDIYYFEMRNGIGGSVVAKFDPSGVTPSGVRTPSSFVSSTGETWTMNGTAWDWATV